MCKSILELAAAKIEKVDEMKAMKIICLGQPRGLFYLVEGEYFIAIDNSEGFGKYYRSKHKTIESCVKYLLRNDLEYIGSSIK